MRRVAGIGVGLCLLLAGCVPDGQGKLVVANPFGQSPEVQQYKALSPAASPEGEQAAKRALAVGQQVVRTNPEMGLRPLFATIGGAEQPEIFHRGQTEILVTEGLVKQCVSDGQLAAVLCRELGKMVAERELLTPPATRQPEREPPPDVPVGNDAGGVLGMSDGVHRVELARFERERHPRDVTVPPPSPDVLARRYLQQAGYTLDDLDAAGPVLRQCDANGAWQKQLVGN
jgi:hypothetical protein